MKRLILVIAICTVAGFATATYSSLNAQDTEAKTEQTKSDKKKSDKDCNKPCSKKATECSKKKSSEG